MMGNYKSYKRTIHTIIFVFVLMLSSIIFLCAEELSINEIVESVMPSLVQIRVYDKKGEFIAGGNGFFIEPGKILTCQHVMEDAYSARITTSIGIYNRVRILKLDDDVDLALLMIIPGSEEYLELENEHVPLRDQELIAVAYDFEHHVNSVSYGYVHSVVNDDGNKDVINSAPIISGWSGSPILNLDGNVIGVNKIAYGDWPSLTISTCIETVKEFLEGPYYPRDLAYAESSGLLTSDFKKLEDFWGPIFERIIKPLEFWTLVLESFFESHVFWGPFLRWIPKAGASIGKTVFAYLFAKGLTRGVFIIILAGILVGWRSPILFESVKTWKKRKAISKIFQWKDGDDSFEEKPTHEEKSDKEKFHSYAEEMGNIEI